MQSTHFICNFQSTYNKRKCCSLVSSITRWISLWDQALMLGMHWGWNIIQNPLPSMQAPIHLPKYSNTNRSVSFMLIIYAFSRFTYLPFSMGQKIPWRRKWQPTPVFLLGKSHGQEEPGGLQSMGRKRVTHNLVTKQQQQESSCSNSGFLELWCWRRLLRVPWTARRSNQSFLKEISPEYSLEGLILKLKLQYFSHLMRRTDSF